MQKDALLEGMAKIARLAGAAILEVYDRADFSVVSKADDSPLTAADLAAHRIIVDALAELAPDIPVLSEESDEISFAERSSWTTYFLVDPLDGTKEFINRNGEFTVNIALIEHHKPVALFMCPCRINFTSVTSRRIKPQGKRWMARNLFAVVN